MPDKKTVNEGGHAKVLKNPENDTVFKMFKDCCSQKMIEQEIEALRELQECEHTPRLISILDQGVEIEYINGKSLSNYKPSNNLSLEEKEHLMVEITKAVQKIHHRKVSHLDVCDQNIMVGNNGDIKIIDFAFAQVKEKDYRHSTYLYKRRGEIFGHISFSSPEKIKNEMNRLRFQQDLFALGVVFYKLFTGIHPFVQKCWEKSSKEIAQAIVRNEIRDWPPSTDPVSKKKKKVIEKSLKKDPKERYETTEEMLEDFT